MKNRKLVQISLVVVILIALGFIARNLIPKQTTIEQITSWDLILVDTEANKVFLKTVTAGEPLEYPMESPFSEGKNAYPVFQCVEDGTIFAFAGTQFNDAAGEVTDPQKDPRIPKCPVCNGLRVKSPELPKGQKSMDVEGPIKIVK